MKRVKTILRVLCALLLFIGVFLLLQSLLTPKYVDDVVEGAFVAEYYREKKDHDVIFIGDCEVYENFSPAVLWEEYGVNSYIRGSAEQYIFQSYYLLEDTFYYEKPSVVVFNVQSLQFGEAQSEAYNRMTLEGMRWSPAKVAAIRASMTEDEHFIEYVFPLLRYHDRWSDLKQTDFQYLFHKKTVSHNGYYMRLDAKAVPENLPPVKPLGDYSFSDRAWSYLDRIVEACKREGVQLLLIKAPSVFPHWYDEWDEQVKAYAEKQGVRYINFLEHTEEIGLDFATDTYDAGQHMNLSGAEKCARWIGRILAEDYGVPDRRGEEALSAAWAGKLASYRAEIEEQKERYGLS